MSTHESGGRYERGANLRNETLRSTRQKCGSGEDEHVDSDALFLGERRPDEGKQGLHCIQGP